MMTQTWLERGLYLGGVLHFSILLASAQVPRALDWKSHLAALPKLLRQMFWVYGVYIVGLITAFGLLSLILAPELANGGPLARAVCGVIAAFWGGRLVLQFFVFDVGPYLTRPLYRIGYRLLTINIACLVLLYGAAVFGPAYP